MPFFRLKRRSPGENAGLTLYLSRQWIRMILSFVLGLAVVYCERREYLPAAFSRLPGYSPVSNFGALVGRCLTRSAPVLILFVRGLYRRGTGFVTSVRFWSFVFWFVQGAVFYPLLGFAAESPVVFLLICFLTAGCAGVFAHSVLIATEGFFSERDGCVDAGWRRTLPCYLLLALRNFGAVLLLQMGAGGLGTVLQM